MKKTAAIGFLILVFITPIKGDIIVNGDFHDGKAHWKGDLQAASDQGVYGMSGGDNSSSAPGVIVTLNSKWAMMYQDFESHENSLNYSVTFKLSGDYAPTGVRPGALMDREGTLTIPESASSLDPSKSFLSALIGADYSGQLMPPRTNEIVLVAIDLDGGTYSDARIKVDLGSTNPQTVTGTLTGVPPHDEKTLFLAFPPGKGSITMLNVALTAGDSSPEVGRAKPGINFPGVPIPSAADNILANKPWSGDLGSAGDDGNSDDNFTFDKPAQTSDYFTVNLHASGVSTIYQTFRAPAASLMFTIVCTPSSDYQEMSSQPFPTVGDVIRKFNSDSSRSPFDSASNSPPSAGTNLASRMTLFGGFTLILLDQKTRDVFAAPLMQDPSQKTPAYLIRFPVKPGDPYTLFVVFPQAHGSVTVKHVYLSNAD